MATTSFDWNKVTSPSERLTHAIGRLFTRHLVLGQLVGGYRHVISEADAVIKAGDVEIEINKCPTACTDGETVWYNPEFVKSLGRDAACFLVQHEIMHNILGHHLRRGSRDPERWNTAIDVAINDILLEQFFKDEPMAKLSDKFKGQGLEGGVDAPTCAEKWGVPVEKLKGESGEVIFSLMPDSKSGGKGKKGQGQGGSGNGAPNGSGEGTEYGKGPKKVTLTPHQLSEMLSKAKLESQGKTLQQGINEQAHKLIKVVQANKQMGKIPAALQRLVEEFTEPQVDYIAVLREFLSVDTKGDYSYATRSRKQDAYGDDIIIPGYGHIPAGGKGIIGFDTSGSIYGEKALIDEMMSEISGMQKDLSLDLYLLYCDAEVAKVAHFDPDENVIDCAPDDDRVKLAGGGGTSFVPVFDWAAKNAPDADFIVYFTDLMGTFPTQQPPCKVIWITFEKEQAPFGRTINISRRQLQGRNG